MSNHNIPFNEYYQLALLLLLIPLVVGSLVLVFEESPQLDPHELSHLALQGDLLLGEPPVLDCLLDQTFLGR